MDVQQTLRRGSGGQAVRVLQIILNTQLEGRPRIPAGGIYGFRTESATKEFQVRHGLAVDGIVGPETWAQVTAAVVRRPQLAPHVRRFVARLGALDEVVRSVRDAEGKTLSRLELFDRLSDISSATMPLQYLIVRAPYVGVIDLGPFFAAAREAYSAWSMHVGFVPPGPCKTLLLGMGQEVSRCKQELKRTLETGDAAKIDRCFSRTDAVSNRCGAEFGRIVAVAETDGAPDTVHDKLGRYLHTLRPLSRRDTSTITESSNGRMVLEILAATILGLRDTPFAGTY